MSSALAFRRYVVWTYVWGSAAALAVTFLLVFLGLEFTPRQWLLALVVAAFVVPCYTLPDIYLIIRQTRSIVRALLAIDRGDKPDAKDVSKAIVDMLNLPVNAILRVTLFHGPAAALLATVGMYFVNEVFDAGWAHWQIAGVGLTALLFASPAHAIFEFFFIGKKRTPELQQLRRYCQRIEPEHQRQIIGVNLKTKLLYLSIFVTTVPLLYLAGTIVFKVDLMLQRLGHAGSLDLMTPLLIWIVGVVLVCMSGVFAISVLSASEVSRSAQVLGQAMRAVETGDLTRDLQAFTTDEYAELFRGYNLMVLSLREEAQILALSDDLAGELNLDLLLSRIIRATTELLDADRGTLFLLDRHTNELFARVAEGITTQEIRIASTAGIAGNAFTRRQAENVADAYCDPRFNREIDERTGYRTKSILAAPVISKNGTCIGVTQVLNKRGGEFNARDSARLSAFTAQIAVALENAKLFEEVLEQKNYSESILRSTSDGIIALDENDRVVTANDAALRIFGRARDDIVGHAAQHVFRNRDAWVLQKIEKVKQGGTREIAVEMELRLDKAVPVSVNLTVNPLVDRSEQNIGSIMVVEDITVEKRMKRFFSPEVADLIISGDAHDPLKSHRSEITVVFIDLRGYTAFTESAGPEEVMGVLREYHSMMGKLIMAHRGTVERFAGDAIMIFFNDPIPLPNPAEHAVRMALEMHSAFDRRAQDWRKIGYDLKIGIGIAEGYATLGAIGFEGRLDYGAIGAVCNLSARLCAEAKGGQTLVPQPVLARVEELVVAQPVGELHLKGIQRAVNAFNISALA